MAEAAIRRGQLRAESFAGPFAFSGEVLWLAKPLWLEVNLSRAGSAGRSTLGITARRGDAGATASLSGTLSKTGGLRAFKGRFEMDGESLAGELEWLLGGPVLSGLAGEAYRVTGALVWDEGQLRVSEADLALEKAKLRLELDGRLQGNPGWQVRLSSKRLDLDGLAGPTDDVARAAPATALSGELRHRLRLLAKRDPAHWPVELELLLDAVIAGGQVIRDVQAEAVLKNGQLHVPRFEARFPGATDIAFQGRAEPGGNGMNLVGETRLSADSLRGFLGWLGLDLSAVAASRLRGAEMSATVRLDGEQLTLSDMNLAIDSTQLRGGLALALRDRLALGLGLAADRLNLDAYLPKAAAESEPEPDGSARNPLSVLGDFDANLDFTLQTLSYRDQRYDDLALKATLDHGNLVITQARIGDYEGLAGSFQGRIDDAAGSPSFDGRYDLSANESGRLLRVLRGLEASDWEPGPISASGTLSGTGAVFSTDTTLLFSGGELQAVGIVEPESDHFDLQVSAAHESLPDLLGVFGLDAGEPQGDRRVALGGRLRGGPDGLTLSDARGRLGGTAFTGTLSLLWQEPVPHLDFDLRADSLDLDDWSGLLAGGDVAAKGKADTSWSREALAFAWMEGLNLQGRIDFSALIWQAQALRQAHLDLVLEKGLLTIRRLSGALADGSLLLAGSLRGGQALLVDLVMTGLDLNLAALTAPLTPGAFLHGHLNLNAELKTLGSSQAQLLANLSGEGELQGDLRFAPGVIESGLPGLPAPGPLSDLSPQAAKVVQLMEALARSPATLGGTFRLREGRIVSDNLRLAGQGIEGLTRLTIDLPRRSLESRSAIRQPGATQDTLTLTFEGPLDQPDMKLGGDLFRAPAAD